MNWKRSVVVILGLLIIWVWQQWPDGRLHLIFCDVGQGDGALVVLGRFQALVDTGADKDRIIACLSQQMPFWDRQLEIVFVSHSDKDHMGALAEIKSRYKVVAVIDKPNKNDIIRIGLLAFDIIKGTEMTELVNSIRESETNPRSVVMRVTYGDFSAIFTGDIDTESELALVGMGVLKKTEVLKVSHHGSKFGSSKAFLEVLRPKWAIISVGAKNNYGHPSDDTLIRLDTIGARILRTDKMGSIELVTNGKDLQILREK